MIKIKFPSIFSSTNTKIKLMKIGEIKTNPKFKALYKQEPEKVAELCRNMKEHGYDRTQPIIILNDGTVIDGHSRLAAAIMADLKEVYVIVKDGVASETDVLLYEEHLQLSRRNLTEAEKLMHLENLLKLKKQAKAAGEDVSDFSDECLAKKLDVSPRQIQKMREVESKATPQQLDAIRSGEMTLNKVHDEIKKTHGPTRKTPVNKAEKEQGKAPSSKDEVVAVLALVAKHLPDIKIPDGLKEDLQTFFKRRPA